MKKTCNKCNIQKDINDFYKAKSNKDGYRNECKSCIIEYEMDQRRRRHIT